MVWDYINDASWAGSKTGHILDKLQNMVNANIKFMKSLFEVKNIQTKLLDLYLVRNSENTFP
jgi:hypothetical protein